MPKRRTSAAAARRGFGAEDSDSAGLFFVDKRGDASLITTLESLPVLSVSPPPPNLSPSPGVTELQSDFISLHVTKKERQRRRKDGKKQSPRSVKPVVKDKWVQEKYFATPQGKAWPDMEVDDDEEEESEDGAGGEDVDMNPEEMAVALDYLQNASVGGLADLSTMINDISSLGALSYSIGKPDAWMDGAEAGLFEEMLTGLDDGVADMDIDGDLIEYVESDAEDSSSSDGEVIDILSGSDEDDDTYLKRDFEGGKSTWGDTDSSDEEGGEGLPGSRYPRATAEEIRLMQILKGDFQPTSPHTPNPSRTQLRKARNRQAVEAKKQRKVDRKQLGSDAAVRALRAHLSGGLAKGHGAEISGQVSSYLRHVDRKIRSFVSGVEEEEGSMEETSHFDFPRIRSADCIDLAPMPSAIRRLVGLLASRYQLTVTSKGKGATKHSVLARTKQTRIPVAPSSGTHIPTEDLIRSVISESGGRLKGNARPADRFDRGFPDKRHRKQKQSKAGTTVTTRLQNKGGGGRKTPASGRGKGGKGNKSGSRAPGTGNAGSAPNPAQPRIGTTVGEGSAPIGESNVGHRMLKALGWAPGQALGARGGTESGNGLINPVDVIVRGRRSGLGNAL